MNRPVTGRWVITVLLLLMTGSGIASVSAQEGVNIPRTVLALYGGSTEDKPQWSAIHQFAEMPLNHLGVKLHYHNMADGLPTFAAGTEYSGVLSWYKTGTRLEDPTAYLLWAESVVRAGKKFVILGDPGFRWFPDGRPVPSALLNRFFERLGLRDTGEWIAFTYDLSFIVKDPAVVEFERTYSGITPPFAGMTHDPAIADAHLVVRKVGQPGIDRCLIATSRQGGYAADGFAVFHRITELGQDRQWYLNPFSFFQLAFDTGTMPKPDTTTLAGRRIYFSHIDGDGWQNRTQIEAYRQRPTPAARVILEYAVKPFPDLPVTVAPVVAELDPEWSGSAESMAVAGEFFALPQVEVGNHTYSHPFDWSFFADGNPTKEASYMHRYPDGGWQKVGRPGRFWDALTRRPKDPDYYQYNESGRDDPAYPIPRAYAKAPFDLPMEIEGASTFLNELAPAGKKARVLMWTGNTKPFEAAIKQTREAGLFNINGGDSRFDAEYPSYAWLSPIGRTVGAEQQIYTANSNENTYTDLWSGRYHGFRFLVDTLENTEHPIRIKPFNLYYHMYSGERAASLKAVIDNLAYARRQPIIPITTSRYCAIAEGFYRTRFEKIDDRTWRIKDRGALQTIRFDQADDRTVDFMRSNGVVGQRHYQQSLYIYLDEATPQPQVTLSDRPVPGTDKAPVPFLLQSRWRIWDLDRSATTIRFQTAGFGLPEMQWVVPHPGDWVVRSADEPATQPLLRKSVDQTHILSIDPGELSEAVTELIIQYSGN